MFAKVDCSSQLFSFFIDVMLQHTLTALLFSFHVCFYRVVYNRCMCMYCSGVYKECAIYTAAVPIELGFFNFLFYMLRRVFDSSSDLLYIFFFFSVPRLLFENVFVFFSEADIWNRTASGRLPMTFSATRNFSASCKLRYT